MTPSSQKPDQRPISFVLHDMAANTKPVAFLMAIRPEDLSRSEPSRMAVHQVFGGDGGFVDSFGPGIGTVQISGHTGWRGNATDDGLALFERLHSTVFKEWHAARSRAVASSLDPDLVKLIFIDVLDNFAWVVAPQQFTLRRSKSQPLLAKYNITLLKLADDVAVIDGLKSVIGANTDPAAAMQQQTAAFSSLSGSINSVLAFNTSLTGAVGAALGSVTGPLAAFSATAVGSLRQVLGAAIGAPVGVAQQLSLAATQVTASLAAIESMPAKVKGALLQVSSAYRNAFCLLGNVFSQQRYYPDYSPFYGASNCSSTVPGGQVSRFAAAGSSGIAALFPATGSSGTQTSAQAQALRELAGMDVTLNPKSPDWMGLRMVEALGG